MGSNGHPSDGSGIFISVSSSRKEALANRSLRIKYMAIQTAEASLKSLFCYMSVINGNSVIKIPPAGNNYGKGSTATLLALYFLTV